MKTAILATLLLVLVSGTSAQDVRYFPSRTFDDNPQLNDFVVGWYTQHLKALEEPSLFQHAKDGSESYRFLWLRTFHHPVSVRLNVRADGTSLLTVKSTNGSGGYKPGKLTENTSRNLSKEETQWVVGQIRDLGFWMLPTRQPKEEPIGEDGAQWVFEGTKEGKYRIVDRWSPEKGPVHELGMLMLSGVAKLKFSYEEVY